MISDPIQSDFPNAPPPVTSISIVVAALNEAANLPAFCEAAALTFTRLGFTCPVVVINDGSTDQSPAILADLSQQYPFLRVIHHPQRRGLTEVLKTALQHTHSDWLYLTAADLESDIQTDLPQLLAACRPGVDAVAGWRQGRRDQKNLASAIANLTCRLGFGLKVHDMNWVKLVRRNLLLALPLERVTHRYILPVLAGLGYCIVEVPTVWHARRAGKSNFGHSRLFSSGREFWMLWWWFHRQGRFTLPLQEQRQ